MPKNFPDVSKLLPSRAKAELKAYYLERLEESELNYRGDPLYREVSASSEASQAGHRLGDYYFTLAWDAFKEARETFDLLYLKEHEKLADGSYKAYRVKAKV